MDAIAYQEARRLVREEYIQAVRRKYGACGPTGLGAPECRYSIFLIGRMLLGVPTPKREAALSEIQDLSDIQALAERLLDVTTWAVLLNPE